MRTEKEYLRGRYILNVLEAYCLSGDAHIAAQDLYGLYRMHVDEGISGKSLKKCKQFNEMVVDAKKGLFSVILVKDISRFARNTIDCLDTIRELKRNGTNLRLLHTPWRRWVTPSLR